MREINYDALGRAAVLLSVIAVYRSFSTEDLHRCRTAFEIDMQMQPSSRAFCEGRIAIIDYVLGERYEQEDAGAGTRPS